MPSEGQSESPIPLFGKQASLTDSFRRVGSLLPEDQEVATIDPHASVGEALRIMLEHQFSQLPIVADGEVFGVFSYRTFADGVLYFSTDPKVNVLELEVIEVGAKVPFARPSDSVDSLLGALNEFDAVLIGSSDRLVGLATPMDVVTYLFEIANHFVLLQEIELALRAVIDACLPDRAERKTIFERTLSYYLPGPIPMEVHELTFSDYYRVISFGEAWPKFAPILGKNRNVVRTKLRPLPELRNALFHFRRQITIEDHRMLAQTRTWLLDRLKTAKRRAATDDV